MAKPRSSLCYLFGLLGVLVLASCGHQASPPPGSSAALDNTPTPLLGLATIAYVAAEGQSGPGGQPFFVAQRTAEIGQYPCQTCHDTALAPPAQSQVSNRWMHIDIQLDHGKTMDCQTCHDYQNLQYLTNREQSEVIPLDHSYQLCGQCHFQQERDWAGGAHGKRLGGWQGKRVILNCTGCHNPHTPAFAKRMPLLFPNLPRRAHTPPAHWTTP